MLLEAILMFTEILYQLQFILKVIYILVELVGQVLGRTHLVFTELLIQLQEQLFLLKGNKNNFQFYPKLYQDNIEHIVTSKIPFVIFVISYSWFLMVTIFLIFFKSRLLF